MDVTNFSWFLAKQSMITLQEMAIFNGINVTPLLLFIKLLFYKALRKTNRWSKFNIKKPLLKKVSIQWLNIQENLKDNFSVWNWLLLLFLFLFVNIRFSRRVAARGYCTGSVTLGCTKSVLFTKRFPDIKIIFKEK